MASQEPRAHDHYRRLVESSPDGILLIRESRIEFLNPAAVRLFGAADAREIVGRSPFDLFHRDSHAVIRDRTTRLRLGERLAPVEEKIMRLDGVVTDVEVHSTSIGGEH